MGKVEATLSGKNNSEYNLKEDAFRCVLTLHSLLKNPPGDFPDNLREDVVKGFVGVFILVRYITNKPGPFCLMDMALSGSC